MSKLLINEPPLQVLPTLAVQIGLNEAIVLQQVHYWISNPKIGKSYDGRRWVRNSVKDWQAENFPFWSIDTIKRTIDSLKKMGVILSTKKLNDIGYDQTLWYSVDYEALDNLSKIQQSIGANCPNGIVQDAPLDLGNLHQPIYIDTIESIKEKELTPSEKTEPADPSILDDLTDPALTDHQKAEFAKRVGASTAHPIYRILKTKAQYCNPSKVLIATAIGILQNITEQEILGIIEWKTKNTIPPYPSEIVGNLPLYRENLLSQLNTPPGPPAASPAIQALYAQTIGKISAIPTNDALARKKCRESWPQNVQDGVLRILSDKKAKSLDRVSLADFAAYCGGG